MTGEELREEYERELFEARARMHDLELKEPITGPEEVELVNLRNRAQVLQSALKAIARGLTTPGEETVL